MNSSQVPIARKEGLVIQEMPEEVLIYDLEENKAFSLNPTAAEIWRSCDGNRTVAEIATGLAGSRDQEEKEKLVWLALDQLKEKNLIANELASRYAGMSRREVIRNVGLATAIALPVIAMLSFPGQTLASTCVASLCGSTGLDSGCTGGRRCCPSQANPSIYGCFTNLGNCGVIPGTAACP
ncbi:MAG: PqqD family protein [Aridibacter famidurans]|nr:PqqD family protein [Aridibacter famidurans]